MPVLLTGVHTWTSGITGAHIQNQGRAEQVRPSSAIIPALRAAACRAGFANGRKDRIPLLRVAEEGNVGVAEVMVDSTGKGVRVIQRGPVANEVVLSCWVDDVGHRRV